MVCLIVLACLKQVSRMGTSNYIPQYQWCATMGLLQIRKFAGWACAGNAGTVFPATDFKGNGLVSDPDMYHGTCVTHVPWCKSGSLTHGGGETFPAHAQPANLRICQEAHLSLSLIASGTDVLIYIAREHWFKRAANQQWSSRPPPSGRFRCVFVKRRSQWREW